MENVRTQLWQFIQAEEGASAVEYTVLYSLIAAAFIPILWAMGVELKTIYEVIQGIVRCFMDDGVFCERLF